MGLNLVAQIVKMQYWVRNYFLFASNHCQMFWGETMPKQLCFSYMERKKISQGVSVLLLVDSGGSKGPTEVRLHGPVQEAEAHSVFPWLPVGEPALLQKH